MSLCALSSASHRPQGYSRIAQKLRGSFMSALVVGHLQKLKEVLRRTGQACCCARCSAPCIAPGGALARSYAAASCERLQLTNSSRH